MTFGIDIDGTWDKDPSLFIQFFNLMRHRGHTAVIVTGAQHPREKIIRLRIPEDILIVCTHGRLKEDACRELGINVDVWIDNEPGTIQRCKILDTSTGWDGL